ncbi:MAG: hypothetical protein PHP28_09155 [Actinomycetota bacterium]|nr:hypothetical protein [Actinomycetota bacterium]MDD5666864.1 hypothetical protein [Actinomycetota bacterium]
MAEHVHQPMGEEIRSIAGYYMVLEEGVLEYKDREILYLVEAAVVDTSCCGRGGMGFIMVPGYINILKARRNEDGLWVSDVDRVEGEEDRREITRLVLARHPGFGQVNFA